MGCFVHGPCGGDGGGCSYALGRSAAAQYELLFATNVTVVCIYLIHFKQKCTDAEQNFNSLKSHCVGGSRPGI